MPSLIIGVVFVRKINRRSVNGLVKTQTMGLVSPSPTTFSSKILSLCESGELAAFVTPVMISNVYYILRKTATHQKVIENIKLLLTLVDVAVISKKAVLEALHSGFKDFEDALQNFSAKNEHGVKIIITRNVKDYKTSDLPVMTPESYLKTIYSAPS